MKGTAVVSIGRGEKGLRCDPRSELRLGGREKRRAKINKWDDVRKKEKRKKKTVLLPR